KADGLAAGKGVVVTEDRDAAITHAEAVLAAGGRVVLEEFLDGPEVSLFCVSDGTRVVPLAPAQDFKRALDDDEGPNTGGMGAYSPLPWAPEGLTEEVLDTVARPTIAELAGRGTPFVGVLYCGLALTSRGLRVVSSTPASATRRPRWSWSGSPPPSRRCCWPPPAASSRTARS